MTTAARAEPARGEGAAPTFRLQLPDPLQLEAGQPGQLQLRLQPAPGYRITNKGPLRIDLRPSADSVVTVKKPRLDRGDAIDPASAAPAFRAQVRAGDPGRFELAVSLQFWLCRGKLCRPVDTSATVQLEVRAAVEPDGPVSDAGSARAARTAPN